MLQSAREQQDRFANSLRSSNDIDMSLVVSFQPNSEQLLIPIFLCVGHMCPMLICQLLCACINVHEAARHAPPGQQLHT